MLLPEVFRDALNIYIDYIVKENLTAAVKKDQDYYFIGVSYGGIYVLCDVFMRILSSPAILKNYGDVTIEVTRKIYNAQITDIRTLYLAIGGEERSVPNDPLRIKIAEFLTVLSTNNLILHEFGHILLGHRDFKLDLQRPLEILTPLFQQCLEYEADTFATNIAVTSLLTKKITIGKEEEVLFLKEEDEKKIYLWNFAVYLYWRLFGNNIMDIEASRNHTHPTYAVRQYYTLALARDIVIANAESELIKDNIFNILKDSCLEVESALSEISHQSLDLSFFNSIFSSQNKSYYKEITDVLISIVIPSLNHYRFYDPQTQNFKDEITVGFSDFKDHIEI